MTRLYANHPLVQVETDEAGTPVRIRMDGVTHGEVGICNQWRVDDDWWREPVARAYFKVVTRDGLPSVHMEHTLAITRDGVFVVTADEEVADPIYRPTT